MPKPPKPPAPPKPKFGTPPKAAFNNQIKGGGKMMTKGSSRGR